MNTIKLSLTITDEQLDTLVYALGYQDSMWNEGGSYETPITGETVIVEPNGVTKIQYLQQQLSALVQNKATDIFVEKEKDRLKQELEDKAREYKLAVEANVAKQIVTELQ